MNRLSSLIAIRCTGIRGGPAGSGQGVQPCVRDGLERVEDGAGGSVGRARGAQAVGRELVAALGEFGDEFIDLPGFPAGRVELNGLPPATRTERRI